MAKTYPVLDNGMRDAEIIGHAATAEEAEAIFIKNLEEYGNDADDIAKIETTMNFRTSAEGYHRSENFDVSEIEGGFFDPL